MIHEGRSRMDDGDSAMEDGSFIIEGGRWKIGPWRMEDESSRKGARRW